MYGSLALRITLNLEDQVICFRGFLPVAFTDPSVNRKTAVLVLVCPGYFISPVPSISGGHSPIRHPEGLPLGDQLWHLVSFVIRIYHDTRSHERQRNGTILEIIRITKVRLLCRLKPCGILFISLPILRVFRGFCQDFNLISAACLNHCFIIHTF